MITKRLKQLKKLDPTKIHKGVNKSFKKIKKITPEHVEEHLTKFQIEVRKHTGTAISTAFALVMALVWKDVVQAFVDDLLSDLAITQNFKYYKLLAAIFVSIIAVTAILLISKWSQKDIEIEEEREKKKK